MEGISAGVLVKYKLDELDKVRVLAYIRSISNEVGDTIFWVNGSPLGYELGSDNPRAIEEYSSCKKLIGWAPKDIIGLYVWSNSDKDRTALGEVASGIAEIVSGVSTFTKTLKRVSETMEELNDPITEYPQCYAV